MDKKELIDLLKKWQDVHTNIEKMIIDLEKALACDIVDSQLYNISWKNYEIYTETIAIILANQFNKKVVDVLDWLSWYCYENDFGKRGFEAKAGNWKRAKKIGNLESLLKIIEA